MGSGAMSEPTRARTLTGIEPVAIFCNVILCPSFRAVRFNLAMFFGVHHMAIERFSEVRDCISTQFVFRVGFEPTLLDFRTRLIFCLIPAFYRGARPE